MAREYAQFKAYRDLDGDQFCLLCHKAPSTHVLFPCGHKCICDGCRKSNGVVDSATWQKALANPEGGGELWSFCPLCNEEIKRISRHTGTEYEDYWKWVNEVKPPLPRGFKAKFKRTHLEARVCGGSASHGQENEGSSSGSDGQDESQNGCSGQSHPGKPDRKHKTRRPSSLSSRRAGAEMGEGGPSEERRGSETCRVM
eukprot:CAMPEP_0205908836 /NCGR_PEP_ID=MMETSP1325-20131115/3479_1 /ASSEMBLY_ACC=CAM_ASM_000708 /TAXON_ID=236786 /ORGANISM="Florenciella sp., Strain RCC1007" /LENGTH=198 /DNA_ID=CAMNT_0053275077 /DNA_START=15 /DNA_END=611 /DNA_ORIENTATION=-